MDIIFLSWWNIDALENQFWEGEGVWICGTPLLRILSILSASSKCTRECWSTFSMSMNLLHIWHLAFINQWLHECSHRVQDAQIFFFALASFVLLRSCSFAENGKACWSLPQQLDDLSYPDVQKLHWGPDWSCSTYCPACPTYYIFNFSLN